MEGLGVVRPIASAHSVAGEFVVAAATACPTGRHDLEMASADQWDSTRYSTLRLLLAPGQANDGQEQRAGRKAVGHNVAILTALRVSSGRRLTGGTLRARE